MGSRSIWPLFDELLRGRLNEIMRGYIRQGHSPEAIGRRLYADHGIEVSGESIRAWLREHGTEVAA